MGSSDFTKLTKPSGKTLIKEFDERFMRKAFIEADKALAKGDVPIGAIIVVNGEIISAGHNLKESALDATAHAEVVAIRGACESLRSWRLDEATMYVTLEPCVMCMGALIQARVTRLVFSSYDPKAGACGSIYDLSDDRRLNHRIEVLGAVLREDGERLLKGFFEGLRRSSIERKTKNAGVCA